GDAVSVGVGVRAAVLVVDAVGRLGLAGTTVRRVGDAVGIVVGVRAAVVVLMAVAILGLVGAAVTGVGHAVLSAVRRRQRLGQRVSDGDDGARVRGADAAGEPRASGDTCDDAGR